MYPGWTPHAWHTICTCTTCLHGVWISLTWLQLRIAWWWIELGMDWNPTKYTLMHQSVRWPLLKNAFGAHIPWRTVSVKVSIGTLLVPLWMSWVSSWAKHALLWYIPCHSGPVGGGLWFPPDDRSLEQFTCTGTYVLSWLMRSSTSFHSRISWLVD